MSEVPPNCLKIFLGLASCILGGYFTGIKLDGSLRI